MLSPKEDPNIAKANANAPHQAIISVSCQIMERLPTGQVTGIPIANIKKLYTIIGKNRMDCEEKVKKYLEKLNETS
jgi:hypothetical protein